MGQAINIESELFTNVKGQKFALDTNVLYWMFYDKCSYTNERRQRKYQNIVTKLKLHNELYVSPLCLYELLVIIEKNEYKIYCAKNQLSTDAFKLKDYRDKQEEREKVKKVMDITYKSIRQFTTIPQQTVDRESVKALIEVFEKNKLDIFDQSLAVFCKSNKIQNIVTDDKDYKTVSDGINIYTANRKYFMS
jgi:predicted nucleic acid-binding protein